MGKDRDFEFEDVLPESWTDALQEFIGTLSSGLRLSKLNNTTVRAEAGEGTAQVGVGIGGLWRWRSANYDVAVSGEAGTKDIFVVAPTANEFENNVDKTDRNWELRVVPAGETPSGVAAYRKVGEVAWSGTEITALAQLGPESVNGPQIRSDALSNNGDITWTREASGALVPKLKADSVTSNEILAGAVGAAEIADALKPSKGAAAGTEALRALGTTASTAAAGNDARLTDERTPKDNSVNTSKITDKAVTTAKINDGAVTLAKLAANLGLSTGYLADGAATSRKTKPICGVVRASEGKALVSGAAYVDVPGATLEITPEVKSTLLVVATFSLQMAGIGALAMGTLNVDGADQSVVAYRGNGGGTDAWQEEMATQVYALTLSAAKHTIKMRAKGSGSQLAATSWCGFLYLLVAA